ncbi:hypothetical protein JOM56_012878, partial [Amanita muscaria]
MKNNPLSVYAVATDLGWDDIAIAAARQTLQTPLESLHYVDGLKGITGVGFYRFLEYRFRCSKSSNPKAEKFTEFKGITQPCSPIDTDNVSDASAPFDSSAPADLILRSSDSVDFFVSGALIRRLSAVFNDMFPFPPEHEDRNGMPIVRVEENSEILRCLLSVIHHDLDEPDMKECQLYIKVMLAARKYRMTTIERRLRKQAANSPLTNSDPLQVYIIAAALGWEELAKTAALNTFCEPLDKLEYVDELRFITGADLYRLMKYRFRCADAASSALEGDPMFPKYGFGQWNGHLKSNSSSWKTNYDSTNPSMAYTQLKVSPRGSTVSDIYSKHLELVASENGKFEMTPPIFFNIVRCARDAEKDVESAIAKVDLCLRPIPGFLKAAIRRSRSIGETEHSIEATKDCGIITRSSSMNANSPYNPTVAADIVLRTSDDVDFYVIGPLLRFVSPVFMDMYTLNHGPVAENEKKDGRPLIRLEEDSRTLRLLLDTIYPYAKDPPLTDVSLFWKIGKASKKYIMDVIEEKLQLWIVSSDLIATSPLRIYAIAIDLGWEGVAMEAARRTLQTPLEKLGHVEELRSLPASGFYRFLEYRLRC